MRGLLAAIALLAAGPLPAASLDVDVAFGGWVGPQPGWTEITVRTGPSPVSGSGQLLVTSGAQQVAASLDLHEGAPASIRLPVPAAATLALELRYPDGSRRVATRELRVAERPLMIRIAGGDSYSVADTPPAGELTAISFVEVGAADLPQQALGWSTIAGIAVDAAALAQLDAPRTNALLGYVRDCGFVTISGASDDVIGVLRRAAGCGARNVVATTEGFEPARVLAAFAARTLPATLGAAETGKLAGSDRRLAWLIAALTVYLVALTLAIAFRGERPWLLALPVGACCVLALGLHALAPHRSLVIWAEGASGEPLASYSGRLRAGALANAPLTLRLPPVLGPPSRCDPGDGGRFNWDASAGRFASAGVPGRLLGAADLCFEGGFPISQSAQFAGEEAPALTNTGQAPWAKAWLVWHGAVYDVVDLAAHATLRVDPARGHAPRDAAQRFAVARSTWRVPSLLLPLGLSALTDTVDSGTGWLLLRLAAAPAEGAPT